MNIQLEQTTEEQLKLSEILDDINNGFSITNNRAVFLCDLVTRLLSELAAEKRRVEAAISDMEIIARGGSKCEYCSHKENENGCDKLEPNTCDFEWRDPYTENTKPDAQPKPSEFKPVSWIPDDAMCMGLLFWCPYCGKPSPVMTKTCPHCGRAVSIGAQEDA